MCDRYSYEYGYICDGCFKELKERCRAIGSVSGNIIEEFLDSKKNDSDPNNWIDVELDGIFIYG